MSVVLVVAAHPDDEILGVGATISKHIKLGDIAYALILGEGQTSRFKKRELANVDLVNELHKDTLNAAKVIGFKDVFFESIADNRFDSVDLLDVVKCVEKRYQLASNKNNEERYYKYVTPFCITDRLMFLIHS